ncbi:Kinesin light chain [Seminavis robusta]|uniref:Kinesin light chain n=1 Tax=Seminavis robusta TaxID=568900 RepID=A0A9N8DR78_9STRA|nr:Kinesin light chain [Seminavis robusta]|eukprot:Sro313_g114740.1 Kinesin light chain (1462) ;mRNA; r:12767-17655
MGSEQSKGLDESKADTAKTEATEDTGGDEGIPLTGLRLSYLEEFIEACGGKSELEGLTTTDVCNKFVKPWTEDTKTSFCEYLELQNHPAVGKANVFISHAWQCQFLDVMDAIVTHMKERSSKENKDPIIWFCLFCNNQHKLDVLDFEWFHKTFQTAVAKIGHTVMVMSPWNDPLPFTRAWCIWEVYSTAAQGCTFEIAMSEQDRLQFVNDVANDTEGAMKKMLATVRAEKSQCYKTEDREKIFQVIEKTIGFAKINAMVFEQYRSWAIRVSTETMLQSIATLGLMYQGQGKYDDAEECLKECATKAVQKLGKNHPRTLHYVDKLANVCMDLGRYDQSKRLVHKCLQRRKATLGEDHVGTVRSMDTLARWCCANGRDKQAHDLLHQCVGKRRKLLGEDHPDTLSSLNRLGTLYMQRKQYEHAKVHLEKCLESRVEVLGEGHPDTLTSLNNLAILYMRQEEYGKAQMLLEKCLMKRKEMLGEYHPDTLTLMNNVASLERKQGDYEKASQLLTECCKKRKEVLGANHPDTLAAIDNLEFLAHRQAMDEGGSIGSSTLLSSVDMGLDDVSCHSRTSRSSRSRASRSSHSTKRSQKSSQSKRSQRPPRRRQKEEPDCNESVPSDIQFTTIQPSTEPQNREDKQKSNAAGSKKTPPALAEQAGEVDPRSTSSSFKDSQANDLRDTRAAITQPEETETRQSGIAATNNTTPTITQQTEDLELKQTTSVTSTPLKHIGRTHAAVSLDLAACPESTQKNEIEPLQRELESYKVHIIKLNEIVRELQFDLSQQLELQHAQVNQLREMIQPLQSKRNLRKRSRHKEMPLNGLLDDSEFEWDSGDINQEWSEDDTQVGSTRTARLQNGAPSVANEEADDETFLDEGASVYQKGSKASEYEASSNGDPHVLYEVKEQVVADPYKEKGTYTGTMSRATGFPHGKGRLDYPDGRWYEGDWKHGRWTGRGRLGNADGDLYEGELRNDHKHGMGTMRFADGRVFEGEYIRGQMFEGTMTYADGSTYEGSWVDGMRHGRGVCVFTDGGTYKGVFKEGEFDGQGKMMWADGGWFEGQWRNGQMHGKGKEIRPDGTLRHEGEWWKNMPVRIVEQLGLDDMTYTGSASRESKRAAWNKPHGEGRSVYLDGRVFEGEFNDGKLLQGRMTYKDASYYDGEWSDNKMHGTGTRVFSDGTTYKGEFQNGKRHGKGTAFWKDGGSYEGEWQDDKPHGIGKELLSDGTVRHIGAFSEGMPPLKEHELIAELSEDGTLNGSITLSRSQNGALSVANEDSDDETLLDDNFEDMTHAGGVIVSSATTHCAYDKLNALIRGKFVPIAYRRAFEVGERMSAALLDYPNLKHPALSFDDWDKFQDEAKLLGASLPSFLNLWRGHVENDVAAPQYAGSKAPLCLQDLQLILSRSSLGRLDGLEEAAMSMVHLKALKLELACCKELSCIQGLLKKRFAWLERFVIGHLLAVSNWEL